MTAKTLYDKLWDSHLVHEAADGNALLYIDRHFVIEVTSAQAYEGLRLAEPCDGSGGGDCGTFC